MAQSGSWGSALTVVFQAVDGRRLPSNILCSEGFMRRKKTSLWFVGSLLATSIFILTVGLAATTRTENVTVGGYYPGIILGFGSFLGIVGIHLVENRRQMLVAAIVFISFGVVTAFCCAVVDGVFAAQHMVSCPSLDGRCQLKVKSNTCYCCDLYRCGRARTSPASTLCVHGSDAFRKTSRGSRAPSHLLRVCGREQLPGCTPPVPAALGLDNAERAGRAPGHRHGGRPGGLQGRGRSVPAGLRPVCTTSHPLQPSPADPGLRRLLPDDGDPPGWLTLPAAPAGALLLRLVYQVLRRSRTTGTAHTHDGTDVKTEPRVCRAGCRLQPTGTWGRSPSSLFLLRSPTDWMRPTHVWEAAA
nr:transmembrane protein 255B isoform X2 [Manis javanica]